MKEKKDLKKKKKQNKKNKAHLKIVTARIPAVVICSLCISALSFAAFVTACIISAVNIGNAGLVVGIIPLIAAVCNVGGFILAYSTLKKENIRMGWSLAASYINGGMVLLYLIIYIFGAIK